MMVGELAALATSLCWSFTSTFFTLSGRLVGSAVTNRTRLLFGLGFLTAAHWLLRLPLPTGAPPWRWAWLAASGVVGLVVGDALLFQAFVVIGPRLSMLLMSLAPLFGALTARVLLGEALSPTQTAGMLATVTGVAWVVLERAPATGRSAQGREMALGVLGGTGAALAQALGLVLAKAGLVGEFPALSGTWMRMLSAALVMWVLAATRGQALRTATALAREPAALRYVAAGSFFGPFLGVTLSLVAVQNAPVGVAATLMALPPIFLLPISRIVFHERFGWRAVGGTVLAVAGVALMALGG
jgi:drug/metabolite transporter (DMT)-like permease